MGFRMHAGQTKSILCSYVAKINVFEIRPGESNGTSAMNMVAVRENTCPLQVLVQLLHHIAQQYK